MGGLVREEWPCCGLRINMGTVELGKESETWYGAGCHGLTVGGG